MKFTNIIITVIAVFCLVFYGCSKKNNPVADQNGDPKEEPVEEYEAKPKSVRVVLLLPSDINQDVQMIKDIEDATYHVQSYFREMLDGYTFTLNNQVIQTIKGTHDKSWYAEHVPEGGAETKWYSALNAYNEIKLKLEIPENDPDHKWIILIPAEGESYNTGTSSILTQQDLNGLKSSTATGDGQSIIVGWRKLAQMIGHTFYLPVTDADNSIMTSSAFVNYPDNQFTEAETKMLLSETEVRNQDFLTNQNLPFAADKTYTFKYGNNMAIGIDGGIPVAGANLHLLASNNLETEKWLLERNDEFGTYLIRSKADNTIGWDIKQGQSNDGAEMGIWTANPIDKNHRYYILKVSKDNWAFFSEQHRKSIIVPESGGQILLWTYQHKPTQKFNIVENINN